MRFWGEPQVGCRRGYHRRLFWIVHRFRKFYSWSQNRLTWHSNFYQRECFQVWYPDDSSRPSSDRAKLLRFDEKLEQLVPLPWVRCWRCGCIVLRWGSIPWRCRFCCLSWRLRRFGRCFRAIVCDEVESLPRWTAPVRANSHLSSIFWRQRSLRWVCGWPSWPCQSRLRR